jgi:hypothetical protein
VDFSFVDETWRGSRGDGPAFAELEAALRQKSGDKQSERKQDRQILFSISSLSFS